MRATSYRRRSGVKVHALDLGGSATPFRPQADLTVGTPNSCKCHCGANVPILANGRLKGHAPGGVRPSIRRGEYKCEGSGRE